MASAEGVSNALKVPAHAYAYLRLLRLPNVVTACADSVAGWAIMRAIFPGSVERDALFPLALASAGLYLSGLVFNDVADWKTDAVARPERPIPSGAAPLRNAVWLGVLLMFGGLAAAACISLPALLHAVALALAVLAYDFGTNHGPVGPLNLGLCRYLNLQLGMSASTAFAPNWLDCGLFWSLHAPALGLGLYAAGLTALAVQEESGAKLLPLLLGGASCAAGMLLAAWGMLYWLGWPPLMLLAALLAVLAWRLLAKGGAERAKQLVLAGVLGICVFDAALLLGWRGAGGWPYALVLALLPLPALVLGRVISQREA